MLSHFDFSYVFSSHILQALDEDECSRWILSIQEGVAAAFNDPSPTHVGGDTGAQAYHSINSVHHSQSEPVLSSDKKGKSRAVRYVCKINYLHHKNVLIKMVISF